MSVLLTGSNLHNTDGLGLPVVPARTPRDSLPSGRAAGAAAYALGERYLGLRDLLAGADVVHAAEIGTWFSAQAAKLRRELGFRLVLTVWETIAWRDVYRWPRERAYRRAVLPQVDLCLAATERAADALLLEGVPAERIEVCASRGSISSASPPPSSPRAATCCPPGRLVWEKGHQDVLRAVRGPAPGHRWGAAPRFAAADRRRRARGREAAQLRGRAGARRSGRVPPHDPLRRDAGALRARLGARARLAAHQGLGGAVRDGADRGDGGRHAGGRVRVGCDPRGARRGGHARSSPATGAGSRACWRRARRPGAADLARYSVDAAAARLGAAYARVLADA